MVISIFGLANRTSGEITDTTDAFVPIWDDNGTTRKTFRLSLAELSTATGGSAASEATALRTLSGTSAGATNLGTFTGSTIADNATIKAALQSLETYAEGKQSADATLTAIAGLDSSAGILEQTGADAFVKREIGVGASTSIPTRADADARYAQLNAVPTFPNVTNSVFTITDGASVDINPANGGIQVWTLGANRTPTATSFAAGQSVTLMIADGASAFAVTWSTIAVTWVGGAAPTLPTSGYAIIVLWKVGSTVYGVKTGDVA